LSFVGDRSDLSAMRRYAARPPRDRVDRQTRVRSLIVEHTAFVTRTPCWAFRAERWRPASDEHACSCRRTSQACVVIRSKGRSVFSGQRGATAARTWALWRRRRRT
jgi:hypothetical protein